MNGVGGCPNVGGICIGCTMPGFPDKFMPFMDEPPGREGVDDGHPPLRRRPSAACARSRRRPSTRNRSGEHPGKQLLTGYKGEWR